jgi:hypothetical protein
MKCLKNIKHKKFLWHKYTVNGEHENEIVSVRTFMQYDEDFKIDYQCKNCGAPSHSGYLSWDEMLAKGFTNEQLKKISQSYFSMSMDKIKEI